MKYVKVLVVVLFGMGLLACGVSENKESLEENGRIVWEADVTHDGEKELICVDVEEIETDSQKPMKISVEKNQKELWSDELYLPGAGNKEYFLLHEEDGDYLLYYYPENAQGTAYFEYKKFYFKGEEMQVEESKSVEFPTYELAEGETIPVDDIVDFQETLNKNLQQGYLLASTMDGKLIYSTSNNKITKTEEFDAVFDSDVNFTYDKQGTDMKEKLLAFEKYLQEKNSYR